LGNLIAVATAQELTNSTDGGKSETSSADTVRAVDQLIQQNGKLMQQNAELEKQNNALMAEIGSLRHALAKQLDVTVSKETTAKEEVASSSSEAEMASAEGGVSSAPPTHASAAAQEEKPWWSPYTPNQGFKFANTEFGDSSISIYSYARYLNQRALEPTYTNAFGVTSNLQQRQDFQLNKVQARCS